MYHSKEYFQRKAKEQKETYCPEVYDLPRWEKMTGWYRAVVAGTGEVLSHENCKDAWTMDANDAAWHYLCVKYPDEVYQVWWTNERGYVAFPTNADELAVHYKRMVDMRIEQLRKLIVQREVELLKLKQALAEAEMIRY